MNNASKDRFLSVQEAADFLHCDENDVLELVKKKTVPHSVLPFGKVLFCPERLRDWVLSFEQMPGYQAQKKPVPEEVNISLADEICRKFGFVVKNRSKYINIYKEQKVYAQLHPRPSGDGIDLALRECGDDPNLPTCKILKPIDICELNGYWKANKNWLEGDGRFTEHPAAAFHIPSLLGDDPESPGWKELEIVLKYASEKCPDRN